MDDPIWARLDEPAPLEPPDTWAAILYAPPGRSWPRLKVKWVAGGQEVTCYLKHSPHPDHGWEQVSVPVELAAEAADLAIL